MGHRRAEANPPGPAHLPADKGHRDDGHAELERRREQRGRDGAGMGTLTYVERGAAEDKSEKGKALQATLADLRKGLDGDPDKLAAAAQALGANKAAPGQPDQDVPALAASLTAKLDDLPQHRYPPIRLTAAIEDLRAQQPELDVRDFDSEAELVLQEETVHFVSSAKLASATAGVNTVQGMNARLDVTTPWRPFVDKTTSGEVAAKMQVTMARSS